MVARKGRGRRTVARQGHAEPLGDFQDEGHLSPASAETSSPPSLFAMGKEGSGMASEIGDGVFPVLNRKLATDDLWGMAEITGCCWFGSCAFTLNRLPFSFQ